MCVYMTYISVHVCIHMCIFFWRASCPSGDNSKYLQAWPNVPRRTKSAPVENCCPRQTTHLPRTTGGCQVPQATL